MKRKILYLILIFMLTTTKNVFAFQETEGQVNTNINPELNQDDDVNKSSIDEEQILKTQINTFKINDFLKETQKYSNEVLEEFNIEQIFLDAVSGKVDNETIAKKIFSKIGKEFFSCINVLISIFVIVIIYSILKSISEELEGSDVSQIVYFVQYILIASLVTKNFIEIINLVKETVQNLGAFMNSLIPLLMTLMLYTGSISTCGLIEPILLFMINFIGNIIEYIILPIVMIVLAFSILSKISNKIQLNKIAKFLKSSIVWFLGVILTLFVTTLSLEGTISSSVDGITAKTTKAAVSNLIPVVGKVLGDSVDTVLGCGVILKNAIGFVGIFVIACICIIPVIKVGILSITYSLAASVIETIADEKIVKLIDEIGSIFKILLAIICSMAVLLIIGVTLTIKISNSGMMYR